MEQIIYSALLLLFCKFLKGALGFEEAVLVILAAMSAKQIVG